VAYPYLDVEPRRYRLRLYNGSQARFYNFRFVAKNRNLPFWVIGMEQSLLPAPVKVTKLLLAPGERADVIIDFSGLRLGSHVTLMNGARAPYPKGKGGVVKIMQFKVINKLSSPDTTTHPSQLVLPSIPRLAPTPGAPMREIVLRETEDEATGTPDHVRLNDKWFDDPDFPGSDENPQAGDSEIWQFINLTVDAHPMHMHLVRFQVYNRQPFDATKYMIDWDAWVEAGRNPGTKPVLVNYFTGPAVPPPPEEMGWKDTVKSYPGQITRLIAKFDLPPLTTTPADYVYHCHILEHEENEMMRPFQVV
jgi:spore coat protein A